MWRIIALYIVTAGLAAKDRVSYKDYKVFSIVPRTREQLEYLKSIKNQYTYWKLPSWINREALIMISPQEIGDFHELMTNIVNVSYKTKNVNVQKLVDNTMPQNQSQSFDFYSYHTLDKIYDNLEELAERYPNKVQVVVGGRTYEGREIKGVKIINQENLPGIFIEGGMSAREWISPATVMYILHQLLTSENSKVRFVADNHNWFIFPVFNPDGYVYSFTDRFWKKTRKPSSRHCIGSDLNRNWDFQWKTSSISLYACSEFYPGSKAFSEIEIKTISEYMRSNLRWFTAYFSFQSFGQQLLLPYAYTDEHILPHYDALRVVSSMAIDELKNRYNTVYSIGSYSEHLGLASGVSIDYIANVFKKPLVYQYQLRDNGTYGYLLPPEQIIPTGQETLDSLVFIFSTISI